MPVVFYVLGFVFAAICANFTYGAIAHSEMVYTAVELANFQLGHWTSLAIAVGSGIIAAIFFSTGAITQTLLRSHDPDAD